MKRIVFISVIITAILPMTVLAAKPVLFFSDITSGPKTGVGDGLGSGAIVTIWGKNLGNSQGNSKVFVGGKEASYVYYWTNADGKSGGGPADLFTYHGMQEVAFSVPSAAVDGAGTISIEVGKVQSNTLPFTVRAGNIYHVKTSGNDLLGDGSWGIPWAKVSDGDSYNGASTRISAGDIIYVGNGVQDVDSHATTKSGIRINSMDGTSTSPIALIAYPGASVLASGEYHGIRNESSDYWVISKYSIKAGLFESFSTTAVGVHTFKGGRIIGNKITDREEDVGPIGCSNGQNGAINGSASSSDKISDAKIFGNYIHDWGCDGNRKLNHTTYFTNRSYSNTNKPDIDINPWEFGWNILKDNKARNGIHQYDENLKVGNTGSCGDITGIVKIHDNVVVNQRGAGISIGTQSARTGPSTCWSNGFEVYNNLLINTGLGPQGLNFSSVTSAIRLFGYGFKGLVKIHNNTIYGYGDPTVASQSGNTALFVGGAGTDEFNGTVEWVNNIVYDTKDVSFSNLTGNTSKVTVHNNNLWYNGGDENPASAPSWDTSPLTSNPDFADTSSNDFSLRVNSPAINAGADVSSIVSTDFSGIPRPQFNTMDIGASEYSVPSPGNLKRQ